MLTVGTERVTRVHHWNESLFSFQTTRDPSVRFESGQFLMMGLQFGDRRVMRAYSIASAAHEEELEFFSIKVPDGPLTSRLQLLKVGEEILVSRKPSGTLVLRDLRPGCRLFLFSTGTGLAPFLSLVRDPELYERFEQIVLVHGVRRVSELAYSDYLCEGLLRDEYLGDLARSQLIYYPTVTREPFRNRGRLTEIVRSRQLFADLQIPLLQAASDRAMICGSASMLDELTAMLVAEGFQASPCIGEPGDFLIERAFVQR